ncbi:MAG: dTDP-4-dehydrorhamnose reductase [Candidatus Sumerlaeaceae bacterium]|nr:dTDP-4-dehydrorhamnose reductase [Candidatus Sumerlaeaceae bacterium]
MSKVDIVVFGAAGMLGSDIMEELRARGISAQGFDLADGDITDAASCEALVARTQPRAVINCAAFTDVNGAESHREEALRINATGAGNIARACAAHQVRCVFVSTDYVFDGTKDSPYLESDEPNPISAYGYSKWLGERETAAAAPNHAIVRTSWLYGVRGRSFPATILAAARAGKPLRVVNDQTGAPTYTRDLARALAEVALMSGTGIFHATNGGACTWYEFACEILRRAGVTPVALEPCRTAEYPTPARRPANSRLANVRLAAAGVPPLPPWPDALDRYLAEAGQLAGRQH